MTRQEVITKNTPLADRLARRYALPGHALLDLEDCLQEARLALCRAVDSYSQDAGSSLETHIANTVKGWLRYYRNRHQYGPSPLPKALQRAMPAVLQALSQDRVTPQHIAENAGLSLEDVVLCLEVISREYVSLDHPTADEDLLLSETLGTEDSEIESADVRIDIRRAIEALPAKQQTVITLRYLHDMSQQEVARAIGLSQMQVSRLERQALDTLRSILTE